MSVLIAMGLERKDLTSVFSQNEVNLLQSRIYLLQWKKRNSKFLFAKCTIWKPLLKKLCMMSKWSIASYFEQILSMKVTSFFLVKALILSVASNAARWLLCFTKSGRKSCRRGQYFSPNRKKNISPWYVWATVYRQSILYGIKNQGERTQMRQIKCFTQCAIVSTEPTVTLNHVNISIFFFTF